MAGMTLVMALNCYLCEAYHQQCPDTVVNEDGGGCDEHGESNKFVKLS